MGEKLELYRPQDGVGLKDHAPHQEEGLAPPEVVNAGRDSFRRRSLPAAELTAPPGDTVAEGPGPEDRLALALQEAFLDRLLRQASLCRRLDATLGFLHELQSQPWAGGPPPLPPERSAAEERECDEELARKWLEDVAAELRPPDDGAADPRAGLLDQALAEEAGFLLQACINEETSFVLQAHGLPELHPDTDAANWADLVQQQLHGAASDVAKELFGEQPSHSDATIDQNRQAEAFARQLAALKAANLPEARAELLRLIDDYIMRDGGDADLMAPPVDDALEEEEPPGEPFSLPDGAAELSFGPPSPQPGLVVGSVAIHHPPESTEEGTAGSGDLSRGGSRVDFLAAPTPARPIEPSQGPGGPLSSGGQTPTTPSRPATGPSMGLDTPSSSSGLPPLDAPTQCGMPSPADQPSPSQCATPGLTLSSGWPSPDLNWDRVTEEDIDRMAHLSAAERELLKQWKLGRAVDAGWMRELDEVMAEVTDQDGAGPPPAPLPECRSAFWIRAWRVAKHTPGGVALLRPKRTWAIHMLARAFKYLGKGGAVKAVYFPEKLLQLERSLQFPRRLRLLFLDAPKSYEIDFATAGDREEFFELASALRPCVTLWCPALCPAGAEHHRWQVHGVCPDPLAKGLPEREGPVSIAMSPHPTEALGVWAGTWNQSGRRPAGDLGEWLPAGRHDVYAVAVQETGWQRQPAEWEEAVLGHLGREYLKVASLQLWDISLVVAARRRCIPLIVNIAGAAYALKDPSPTTGKGGIAISFRVHDTLFCFVTCQLAPGAQRHRTRDLSLAELFSGLRLHLKKAELTSQADYLFLLGDLGYRVDLEPDAALQGIATNNFEALAAADQLTQSRIAGAVLQEFGEHRLDFPPTFPIPPGTVEGYEAGAVPCWPSRVLYCARRTLSLESYGCCPSLRTSRHLPVSAAFRVEAQRPYLFVLRKSPAVNVALAFHVVTFVNSGLHLLEKPVLCFYCSWADPASNKSKAGKPNALEVTWPGDQLPAIHPYITDVSFLATQRIVVTYRDAAEKPKRCWGTTAVSLTACDHLPLHDASFDVEVLLGTRGVGRLRGRYSLLAVC